MKTNTRKIYSEILDDNQINFGKYSWSFDRMHPIAQCIVYAIAGFTTLKIMILCAWVLAALLH